jgi:hypothetical protein
MTFPANAFVYEFLYRGQPPGSAVAPDYHVIVGVPGTDAFGNPTLAYSQPMTPDQAVAGGLALPAVVSGVNTALTAQIATLQAQIASLEAGGAAPAPTPAPTMQLVSTSTPALNGAYAVDSATQQRAAAVSLYIQVNGKFPAAQTALSWPDASGAPHVFPTTAEFQAFATALADFVAALDLGQTPAQPVTIA